ncbi:ElyC/SanA/YdcF family protein [Thalassotalea ponticola]|uniref:ElyC/SanA/YdcF family protein n=1 Tax=Thalassotalea ponticola TaxID=1523392 RepID=UPI0025B382A5|nr:ElyC/SanA/YdcF family protein [Thalassotalea ponticola]MDN3653124.1 ElyC/SanA/YdcF family protein [Thalassotalea ponticola]
MDWFWLKKLIGQLLQPMVITLILMLLSLWCFERSKKLAKISLTTAVLVLFSFSFIGISQYLIKQFEQVHPPFQQQQSKLDYIVVLGCGHVSDQQLSPSQQLITCSLQRTVEALRIAMLHPEATIITSGAAMHDRQSNAHVVKQALLELGYSGNIITNEQARDTEDEAIYLAESLQGRTFALITNANHMPRAMRYFQQQQLTPIAAPTGYYAKNAPLHWQQLFPDGKNLMVSERVFYEFFGQIWQWLKA